uniref:Uncharacterized protein n=1 Tax=Nonomuraea gerenzanensis TaxID=93944 RepID=A0A1M4EL43_9ACTN|nr:hypothetical protein BN4615_P9062 [Nonomuraea gerenzanensis]
MHPFRGRGRRRTRRLPDDKWGIRSPNVTNQNKVRTRFR